jgi:hypothetical protein
MIIVYGEIAIFIFKHQEGRMARRPKQQLKLPEKTCWHLYSLQELQPDKFLKVVEKILKRDYLLIKLWS